MPLAAGLRATVDAVVTAADTAAALGSGDLAVLGTPRVLALAEAATVRAVSAALPPERTTVGIRVVLDHRAPAAVGAAMRAEAILEHVEGNRLEFRVAVRSVQAASADTLELAAGSITRMVVDRARFAGSPQLA